MSKPTILVVDDNKSVRRVLSLILESWGFEVTLAESGARAVELFAREAGAFQVVLLDVLMPGQDGTQTLTALHRIDARIPVVFLSGDTGRYTHEELLGLGATCVLQKPPDLVELEKVLRALIQCDPEPVPTSAATNRRVAVRHHPALGTTCRLDPRSGLAPHLGLVWNLSSSGISFLLREPPPTATALPAELKTADHRGSIPVTLQVVHVRPICTGDYYLGAQFDRPLAPDELDSLLSPALSGT